MNFFATLKTIIDPFDLFALATRATRANILHFTSSLAYHAYY